MFRIGDILDNTYQLAEEIGSGGVGIIYKAYHIRLQKYVVLKKIKDNFTGSVNNRAEVDILKKLHHTYLPQVYDFLQIDGQVFTVMDYIDGYDLKKYEDAGYVFSEEQLVRWLGQLLEVLSYLHGHKPQILHTDIKPANIMITPEGNICLIDFNISLDGDVQMDMQGVSRQYGSPEQMRKAELFQQGLRHDYIVLDERTDIYSTGISFLYLMKNGSYSEAFCNIINKAADPDIHKRYKSADKMLNALQNIEKQDSRYKRYEKISLTARFCFGLLGIISGFCIYYGYKTMIQEEYQKAYQSFQAAEEQEMNEETEALGMEILNSAHFQTILKKTPEDKAYILHTIGDSLFNEENYTSAAEYYEEALTLLSSSGDKEQLAVYYRDLTISQARAGNVSQALVTMERAKLAGLSGEELKLAEGEIKLEQGYTEEAMELLEETARQTTDSQIKVRTALLQARAYYSSGDLKAAIAVLEQTGTEVTDRELLRELGTLYNEQGNQKKAYEAFQKLNELGNPTYEDEINLILCQEFSGEYEKCEAKLLELIKKDAEDYRVYMYLSRVELKRELNESNPDYSDAIRNYEIARSYYEKEKSRGVSDDGMEELKKWIEKVR